jgi:hypothetical protein
MLSTILIVVLILLLVGALPAWPYSASWGYGPGGLLGTVLVIVVILALLARVQILDYGLNLLRGRGDPRLSQNSCVNAV